MSTGELRCLSDAEAVCRAAAEEVSRRAELSLARHGRFRLVLSGGSTPRRLYALLATSPHRDRVDWRSVDFFWGDERAVKPDHLDSNYRMAREAWLEALAPEPARVHRMEGERGDLAAAARDYQEEIARVFAVAPQGPPPAFDLVLLGLGPDSHTASLFPGTAALSEPTAWVVENPVPKLTTSRLTLTAPILTRAAAVLFLVAGVDKAPALAAVREGPRDPACHPAQLIRPAGGELLWLVDAAAASKLSPCENDEEGGEAPCP